MTENEPRIFLCHAQEDKPRVKELYHQLQAAGYHPWLDEEDLLPGQTWWVEIKRVISDPNNLIVVCLSRNSITKRGTVQREIKRALDILEEMPEDTIYLIPSRLEVCQVPDRLSELHWVDLFEPDGFEKLRRALDFETGKRQPPRQPFEPELILIPAGEFLMGSDHPEEDGRYLGEQPQHRLYLPSYYLAKIPVTNAQYTAFVRASGHEAPGYWKDGKPPRNKEDHPVVWVTWYDAVSYCKWLAGVTGKLYRLPSEAEWEKAARGTDGRAFPWGNEPADENRCNFAKNVGDTTPVGQYSPRGDSPYGLVDMAGNVWEWTQSLWGKDDSRPDFRYPYDPEDGREDSEAEGRRVLRGGAFYYAEGVVRCACRGSDDPQFCHEGTGFRVCVIPGQK